jgi:hypothetical protein
MRVEGFVDFGMGDAGKVFGQEGEQGVAQVREAGQHAAMARARMVLAPDRVAAPVVADLGVRISTPPQWPRTSTCHCIGVELTASALDTS